MDRIGANSQWWKRCMRRWPETWAFTREVHQRAWKATRRSAALWVILAPVPLDVAYILVLWSLGRIENKSDLLWHFVATMVLCAIVGIVVYVIGLVRAPVRMQLEQRKELARIKRNLKRLSRETSRNSAFELRPRSGDAMMAMIAPDQEYEILAQLAVKNTGPRVLQKCSVRLVNAVLLLRGHLWSGDGAYPSIQEVRNETFLLQWSRDEDTAYGDRRQWIDIPPDGSWRILDVAYVEDGLVRFVSANPRVRYERCAVGSGRWWKLDLRVASETDSPNTLEAFFVLGHGSEDPTSSPIIFDSWKPRGENILEIQREKRSSGT